MSPYIDHTQTSTKLIIVYVQVLLLTAVDPHRHLGPYSISDVMAAILSSICLSVCLSTAHNAIVTGTIYAINNAQNASQALRHRKSVQCLKS